MALGGNGSVTITGYLAEAGRNASSALRWPIRRRVERRTGITWRANCQRSKQAFTSCAVTYTAPATIAATGVTYVVATAGDSPAKTEAAVLLNTAGVSSNPAAHQGQLVTPMLLGSSGGNNNDFDANGNTIVDCCSGTLGALIEDGNGRQYLLSNNHVLAQQRPCRRGRRHCSAGADRQQLHAERRRRRHNAGGPLTGWLPLKVSADERRRGHRAGGVAQLSIRAGSILELGARQTDGTLAAAPPGISSTGGKGEAAGLRSASGEERPDDGTDLRRRLGDQRRCAVDYYRDCAETQPYLTKTFTNQLGISGNRFSDAGDSGALVVDADNAEPVGLYFAGGTDASGVGQGMANPVGEVLSELSTQVGGDSYTFVGGADHPVSCLSYGDSTVDGSAGARAAAMRKSRACSRHWQRRACWSILRRHSGRGHGQEQRPPRRGRSDCLCE